MTKVFFVRHAEPNYDNHDDRSRELSPRGMEDRKKVTSFLADKNRDKKATPAEYAWIPIEAEGYMYIDCMWVSGSFKGHGY